MSITKVVTVLALVVLSAVGCVSTLGTTGYNAQQMVVKPTTKYVVVKPTTKYVVVKPTTKYVVVKPTTKFVVVKPTVKKVYSIVYENKLRTYPKKKSSSVIDWVFWGKVLGGAALLAILSNSSGGSSSSADNPPTEKPPEDGDSLPQ
jgi:hypothetical protein